MDLHGVAAGAHGWQVVRLTNQPLNMPLPLDYGLIASLNVPCHQTRSSVLNSVV